MPNARARAPRLVTAAVLVAFAATRLVLLSMPSEKEFDEGVYLLSARSLLAGHELFTSVFSSQPPAFLETLAAVLGVFGDTLETGRLLTLAFTTTALAAVASLARRTAGPWPGALAAAMAAFSVTVLDLGHVVQAESPSLALALASLGTACRSRSRGWDSRLLALAGALFGAALLFKLVVAPLVVPLGLLLLMAPGDAWRLEAARPLELLRRGLLFALPVVAALALPLAFYDHAALWEQTVTFHVAKHEAFPHSRVANLWRIVDFGVDHAALVAAAAAGTLLAWRRQRVVVLWAWGWLLAAAIAVMEQSPLFWRHFVLLVPPLALLAAGLAGGVADGPRKAADASLRGPEAGEGLAAGPALASPPRGRAAGWIAGAVAIAAVGLAAAQGLPLSSASESLVPWSVGAPKRAALTATLHRAAAFVAEQTRPGDYVTGDDLIVVYLSGREAPPGLTDTSLARILSGSLTFAQARDQAKTASMIVLRKQGRLSRLKGFVPWVSTNFRRVHAPGAESNGTRGFWQRKER